MQTEATAPPTAPAGAAQARARAEQRLAAELYTKAAELGRSDCDQDLAVLELISLSGGDLVALELARGRCLAVLDLLPDDRHASRALDLLTLATHPS